MSVFILDIKRINEFVVFFVIVGWFIWVYIWMLIVVNYFSFGEIELWEVWVILVYMLIFVFYVYLVDYGCKCCKKKKVENKYWYIG